ncbi:helix-turn-helix domain-containing protein [Streptomyces populi]
MTTGMKPLPDDLPKGKRDLAEALRKAHEDSGKSMRQVAIEVGISPAAVSLILSGKRKPREATLNRLIRATTAREEREADPRHSYITEGWKDLLLGVGVWLAVMVIGLLVYLVHQLAAHGSAPNDHCRPPYCRVPPNDRIPAPSPGPWPKGLPEKSGYLVGSDDPYAPPKGMGLYQEAQSRSGSVEVKTGALLSVACSVRPDPSRSPMYLVRVEAGEVMGDRREVSKVWFWVDRDYVTPGPQGGEPLVVPQCDRQRQTAVDMRMAARDVAYLADVSRLD